MTQFSVALGVHVVTRSLLERGDELELLGDVVDRTADGNGAVVLVEGPAGVGKSSLLAAADLIARERGLTVLAARASQLEAALPFGVARQLLPAADLIVAGPDAATDEERSTALLLRCHDELTARIGPGSDASSPHLLLVDDAHWGDPGSLHFLAHLALRVTDLPVALVIGIRIGGAPSPAPIDALRGAEASHLIRPQPLSDAAVRQLVHETCGADASDELVAACATATAGNPFYLRELLRELETVGRAASPADVASAAPESVLRAVLARLASMGEAHARLATAVAVLGDGAPLAWAAELAEIAPAEAEAAADALATAELLVPGEPLELAHPLIASTLRADLGAFARARAHRDAADVLRRAGAPVGQIAGHLVQTRPDGDPDVVRILREAAAVAREHGDPHTAATLLHRAVREPPARAQRGGVLVELARAEAIDSNPAAMRHLEEALETIEAPHARAQALAELARLMHQAGDYARAAALAQRGRAEVPDDDPLQPRLQAVFLGAGLIHPPLHQQASEQLSALTHDAIAGRPPAAPALRALVANQLAMTDGDGGLAGRLAADAFAEDPLVDDNPHGTSLGFAAWTLLTVDALALAEPLLDEAVRTAAERGAVLTGVIAVHNRAQLHYLRGRLDLAMVDAERSLEAYREGWAKTSWSAPKLAWIHLQRGDLDAAAAAVAAGEDGDPGRVEYTLLLEARAALELVRGNAEQALVDATGAIDQVRVGFGRVPSRGFSSRRLAALAAHRLGRDDQAQELVDELLQQLEGVDAPRERGTALMCAGTIAGPERRLALLTEAVEVLERSQSTLVRAHARLALGAAQRRAGAAEPARESLAAVLEQAERMGAIPLVDRARSELWKLGMRPRRAARSGIGSLTPSERRIAELAAKGLTTPQITRELFVTRKTVESHLSRIYRKLDIAGRTELPDALSG